MKKISMFVLTLLAFVLLAACKPTTNKAPVFSGVGNTSTPYGVEFNPMAGVTAYDEEDGDLTKDVVVTGKVDPFEVGPHTLTYYVEDSGGESATATRVVTVNPSTEAELANGWYDYKFATPDIRHTFFAAGERWLLENGYAGIPLAAQSGLSMQHDRIVLPVDDYIPSFGWGTNYSTLTKDDAEVAAENADGKLDLLDTPAVAGNYTFRKWESQEPSTFNYYEGESTTESTYGSYINGSFYSMALNDTATGWEFVPDLAADEPEPVDGELINGKMTARVWKIPLRDNLKWAYNVGTDTSNFPAGHDDLDARDFEYTYRLALDNEWFRAISGGGDFATQKIKGAEAYSAAVARSASQQELDALWEDFGIKASTDGKVLTVEYTEAVSLFNFKYSFGMPAVNKALYESLTDKDLYATEPKYVASSGLYRITHWETDLGSRYEKVSTHPRADEISWTHESIRILKGETAQDIAFESFESGHLDSVGVPNKRVDEFKEDPRVLRTPGASVWSLNINMVGSVQAQQAQWPGSDYVPEPILGNKDFRLALYFSLNRDQMTQYDAKTYPTGMKISQAYYVDPEGGVPYRSTPEGMSVGENMAYSTNGFDPEAAAALFKRAVAAEIAAGNYKRGTENNYTEIELEVLTFDADSGAAIADNWINFAKDGFETLVDDENFVKVVIKSKKMPGSQIYDEIKEGRYELALSSIDGNTLDAASFLDIFLTDNRSGFLLNYGYDSSVAEIDVRWTEDGVERYEVFSLDGIYELLNGKVYLSNGNKISEFGSVDQLVDIYLIENDLTEVSRSEANGAALLPVVLPKFKADEGSVAMPLVLVAKDEDDKESSVLVVVVKTGSIYEIAEIVNVKFEDSKDAILDVVLEDMEDATKEAMPENVAKEFADYYGGYADLSVFDEVYANFYSKDDDKLAVIIGKAGDVYVLVLNEDVSDLKEATAENLAAALKAATAKDYGGDVFNVRNTTNDDEDMLAYIGGYGAKSIADMGQLFKNPVDEAYANVYHFDIDADGGQPGKDDKYSTYVFVAVVGGYIDFAYHL